MEQTRTFAFPSGEGAPLGADEVATLVINLVNSYTE